MEIFEYIRTYFHVVKAFITQDKILFFGLGFLGLFVLWTVFSLVFSHEMRVGRVWRKMTKVINGQKLTQENYFEFSAYFQKLPVAVARNWKKYERSHEGKPSDYITQADMLDNPLSGGVHKQNRSIMKFSMWTVSALFFVISIAALGSKTLTGEIVAESLLVPGLLFLLYRLNYYIYTAIRQYEYKLTIEDFNEFVDLLDRTVDVADIFDGAEDVLAVSSNCYEGMVDSRPKATIKREVELGVTRRAGETSFTEPADKTSEPAQNSEYEFPRTKDGNIVIRSQRDFAEALMVVEKLLEQKDGDDEKSKKVAQLMDAMNKYRNKKLK